MSAALARIQAAFREGIRRDPIQSVSEWADQHRFLSQVASAEPGRWRTSRTPYLRGIMDALSPDDPCSRVVFIKGAQLGGTECGNNWLGHIIHRTPAPMLYVEPTLDVVKKVSRQRISPMIEASPVLRALVSDSRSRDAGNTIQVKEFKGGLLLMTGANSAAGLRSMPIRFLFCDEVDEYPGDVEGQGDPVALAEKRTSTFARHKTLLVSSPTVRGLSRIEREYLASDQRRYFVPCPHCGHMDWIVWQSGGWEGIGGTEHHHQIVWQGDDPTTVAMACSSCGGLAYERSKTTMLANGEWRPTAPGDGKTKGFHISGLYSPLGWKSWRDCLVEFQDAKDDPFRLKTWVNTVLAETWQDSGTRLEAGTLKARLETFPAEVPHGVGILVAAVDVQGDRLETQVVGFGDREESWLIAFEQVVGDPEQPATWLLLDEFLRQSFTHASGQELRIERAVVDSGGLHTEQVYRYCRARLDRRVYAVKGGSVSGMPLVGRASDKNRYRVPLFVLCVDTGKDMLLGRLQMTKPGAGYIHLPHWVDDEYLAQMTAERAVRKYVKGRGAVREWVKLRERNEAFDLWVYSIAALHICGQTLIKGLAARARRFSATSSSPDPGVALAQPAQVATTVLPKPSLRPMPRRRKGWMGGV